MDKTTKSKLCIVTVMIIQTIVVLLTINVHNKINIDPIISDYKSKITTLQIENETKDTKIVTFKNKIYNLEQTLRVTHKRAEESKKRNAELIEKQTITRIKTQAILIEHEKNIKIINSYITNRYSKVPVEVAELISKNIMIASKKYSVDFHVIVGLIEIESHFNPYAYSKAGARGLMQVMYKIWKKTYNITDSSVLHGIGYNIDIGTKILKHYINKNNGDLDKALRNYNGSKGSTYPDKVLNKVGKFILFKAEQKV